MMNKDKQTALPPRYYLDNFNILIGFSEGMYGALLSEAELEFIASFRQLSEDARCLFIRFVNRRGLFFRTDKLLYPEITNIEAALDELLTQQFCELPGPHHQPMAAQFLDIYSKAELSHIFKGLAPAAKGISALKKPELIECLLEDFSWPDLLSGAIETGPAIKHGYEQELELLKFLFFGHLGGDMSEFVVRDLGMLRYEKLDESKLVARFSSRQEIEEKLSVSLAYAHFRELREQKCPDSLYKWYMEWAPRQQDLCAAAQPFFHRLTLKLARELERQRQPERALEVYKYTTQVPARERRVRLLQKAGELEEALALCEQMEQEPQNAEELFFARDFKNKLQKKKATKSTTRHLKSADTVRISEAYRYAVEKGVMHYYTEIGQEALYSENYLWRSLFGLLFWDIVFDQDMGVYHSPLQRAPSGLYLPDFMELRLGRMQERVVRLHNRKKLLHHIEQVYEEKWGLVNPLISWHENTLPLIRAACSKLEAAQMHQVLMEMGKNLRENGRGFPDLFTWTKKGYSFIEVKSPNDTLSAQQLFWLQFFRKCGIQAQVLKVEWV
jgi:hypothetical protein